MNYSQIQQLIPFVDKNFITFPLATTEGVYIPFYNFWQSLSTKEDLKVFIRKATAILENTGYKLRLKYEEDVHIYNYGEINDMRSTIVDFQIYPIYELIEENDGDITVKVNPIVYYVDVIDLLIKIIGK